MSRRRQKNPWIHRWSRYAIAAIAALGAIVTAWLTVVKLTGGSAVCPTEGCTQVLSSPYAQVFGLPLTLFGCLAYVSMTLMSAGPLFVNPETQKELRLKLEEWSWLFLLIGSTAMTVFSGYLMYVLAFKLQVACLYCITSATFSLSMFLLTLFGRTWEDVGQLFFTGVIVAIITFVGTLGVYANVNNPVAEEPTVESSGAVTPPVTTSSGRSEMALAEHLSKIGARMYGAYWCPHCHDQKQLFGRQATEKIPYIECAPDGQNSQTQLCLDHQDTVTGYPTWEINGEYYPGTQSLQRLAELSGYKGPMDFKN